MSVNKNEALELAKRVEGYINSDTLTENEKETIINEAVAAYDENINAGWNHRQTSQRNPWTKSAQHWKRSQQRWKNDIP